MLRFDKLTVKAQEALQAAQEMGARSGQQQIEPLHLLWALVAQGDGVVPPLLQKLGVSPTVLAAEAEKQIGRLPKVSDVSNQSLSRASNDVLEHAFDEAQRLKDEYVSTEHILLAIAAADRDPAGQLLAKQRREPRCDPAGDGVHSRQRPRYLPESRSHLSRDRTVCARPYRGSPPREARSGDRPR